jgi:hypothetical protein
MEDEFSRMEESKADLGQGNKVNLGQGIQWDQRCIPLNYPALFMRESRTVKCPCCDIVPGCVVGPQW